MESAYSVNPNDVMYAESGLEYDGNEFASSADNGGYVPAAATQSRQAPQYMTGQSSQQQQPQQQQNNCGPQSDCTLPASAHYTSTFAILADFTPSKQDSKIVLRLNQGMVLRNATSPGHWALDHEHGGLIFKITSKLSNNSPRTLELSFPTVETRPYLPAHVMGGAVPYPSAYLFGKEVQCETTFIDNVPDAELHQFSSAYPDYTSANVSVRGVYPLPGNYIGLSALPENEFGIHPFADVYVHKLREKNPNAELPPAQAGGLLVIDKREFEELSKEAAGKLRHRDKPTKFKNLELHVAPVFLSHQGDGSWSSRSELAGELASDEIDAALDKSYQVHGTITIHYIDSGKP